MRLRLVLALMLFVPVALYAQDGSAPTGWLGMVWPVIVVAVPLAISAGYQALKKHWLKALDRLSPSWQRLILAAGTALITSLGAHFGADLTGVEPSSAEGLSLIVMSILGTFGSYNVVVAPVAARKAGP